jgi:phage tail-like protein
VKPHASPNYHAIQYLLGRQTQEKLAKFRGYKGAQSYPSRTKDTDDVDFSTGSVGLGVCTHGGFSRAKGMAAETKVESYHEGGLNEHEHKFATMTTYPNVVLERGVADPYLWTWHRDVVEGRIERRTLSIILQDEAGKEVRRWHADGAYPVKWSVADLDAASSQVLVESVEFAHHGLRAD